MASQLSKLMTDAGASLIRYPDLVLVLAGHGIGEKEEKKKKKDPTKYCIHRTQLSGNSLRSSGKCQLARAKLWFHFSPYEKELRKTEAFKIFPLQHLQS